MKINYRDHEIRVRTLHTVNLPCFITGYVKSGGSIQRYLLQFIVFKALFIGPKEICGRLKKT